MKYLLLIVVFTLVSCSSQEKICVKKDVKLEKTELENESIYFFSSENFGKLENCKVKIENKVFWANKMPMIDKKDNSNNIKIMGSINFDNSKGEEINIFKGVYLKVKSRLIPVKVNENFIIKKEEIKKINFSYSLGYKDSLKEKLALVFFLKSKDDNLLLESDEIAIKIAH